MTISAKHSVVHRTSTTLKNSKRPFYTCPNDSVKCLTPHQFLLFFFLAIELIFFFLPKILQYEKWNCRLGRYYCVYISLIHPQKHIGTKIVEAMDVESKYRKYLCWQKGLISLGLSSVGAESTHLVL